MSGHPFKRKNYTSYSSSGPRYRNQGFSNSANPINNNNNITNNGDNPGPSSSSNYSTSYYTNGSNRHSNHHHHSAHKASREREYNSDRNFPNSNYYSSSGNYYTNGLGIAGTSSYHRRTANFRARGRGYYRGPYSYKPRYRGNMSSHHFGSTSHERFNYGGDDVNFEKDNSNSSIFPDATPSEIDLSADDGPEIAPGSPAESGSISEADTSPPTPEKTISLLDQIDDIDTEISMIEEKLLSLVREQREIQDYETSKALEVDDEENMDLTLQKENSDLDDNDNVLDESNSMDVEENITVRDVLLPVVHGKWKNYDFHRLASRIKYENQFILESSKCPSSTAIEVLNFSVDPIYFSVSEVLSKSPHLLDKNYLKKNLIAYVKKRKMDQAICLKRKLEKYESSWKLWRNDINEEESKWDGELRLYSLSSHNENTHHPQNRYVAGSDGIKHHLLNGNRKSPDISELTLDDHETECLEHYANYFINRNHLISSEKSGFYWKKTLAKVSAQFLYSSKEEQSFLYPNFARIYFSNNNQTETILRHSYLDRNNQIFKINHPCNYPQVFYPWTDSDREAFIESYLKYPKRFGLIAKSVGKSVSECVQFYYRSKKRIGFKRRLRQKLITNQRRVNQNLSHEFSLQTRAPIPSRENRLEKKPNVKEDRSSTVSIKKKSSNSTSAVSSNTVKDKKITVDSSSEDKREEMVVESSEIDNATKEKTIVGSESPGPAINVNPKPRGRPKGSKNSTKSTTSKAEKNRTKSLNEQSMTSEEESDIAPSILPIASDSSLPSSAYSNRWTVAEKAKAVQGFALFGKDFNAVSKFLRTKSESQCRTFYASYKGKLGLDTLIIKKPSSSTSVSGFPMSMGVPGKSLLKPNIITTLSSKSNISGEEDAEDSSERTVTEDEEELEPNLGVKSDYPEEKLLFNGVLQLPSFLQSSPIDKPDLVKRHFSYSGPSVNIGNVGMGNDRKFSWPFTSRYKAHKATDAVNTAVNQEEMKLVVTDQSQSETLTIEANDGQIDDMQDAKDDSKDDE